MDIRILWEDDRYDGPLSGMCDIDGYRYYFIVDDPIYDERTFCLYKLTEEQMKDHDRRHKAFQEYVGEHCDYDENGRLKNVSPKPRSEYHKFYDNYPFETELRPTDDQFVGKFMEYDFIHHKKNKTD